MKKLVLFIFIGISCDSRKDSLEAFNEAPLFTDGDETVMSLTDSLKLSQGVYILSVDALDPNNNLMSVTFDQILGSGQFVINGNNIETGITEFNEVINQLGYDPINDGKHEAVITLTDQFGLSASLDFDLVAFDNLPPVAIVVIENPSGVGPFERLINASDSFDNDSRFGGRIVEYEYSFLGIIHNTDDDRQTVIFPLSGNYQIIVRVLDNDGVWSSPVAMSIPI